MPDFSNYQKSQTTKLLYLGHTGAGKTGSLCSLAAAGYNIRILDLDNGAEIVKGYIINPKSIYLKANPPHWTADQAKDTFNRMTYVTITETAKLLGANIIPRGDAWGKLTSQLAEWKDGDLNLGNIASWGQQDILVIDSLSALAKAAFNFVRVMDGKILKPVEQSHYNKAQNLIIQILDMIKSNEIKCNVIMICHITYFEPKGIPILRGFPQTIGKAIGPQIGQFFNHAIRACAQGQGTNQKRVILTNTSEMIELKSANPLQIKSEYNLETGLAEYFADIRKDS